MTAAIPTTIPSASTPPENATPSAVRKLIERDHINRRSLLKGVLTTGMVLGLSALDLLPGRNPALAGRYGGAPWEYWNNCHDYSTSTRRADWRWCNPDAARVSGRYCKTNIKRHRTAVDGRRRNGCEYEDYRIDFRCWNLAGTQVINAWVWRRGQSGGNLPSVICSDGKTYVLNDCGPDYHYKSACREYLE
ncbi:hypothetical protein [Actinopolymorpha rutila]|uniref:Uncharacterized protein n=1 Tax=Actinopolymorpha rutila TaxID=446787 RepID=A0A852Z9J7_9ACTN|nr:hypothetical protein [Actinopolymorpha rutila]NYH88522.1 hypothetical protein [Actinopolymorpha rutila]